MDYYLGIDGGGTRTTAAVSDDKGRIIYKSVGKTINFYSVGIENARENLSGIMNDIYENIGDVIFKSAFVGCSALDDEGDADLIDTLCGGIIKSEKIKMNNDVYVALFSGDCTVPRCVVICGTGSMAAGIDADNKITVKGGWGHLIGDGGSAYSIAINALSEAVNLYDENRKDEPLVKVAKAFFKTDDLRKIILENLPENFGYTGNVGINLSDVKSGKETLEKFIAQLSPKELEAISRGDYIMNSPLGAKGNAGVMGGVLPSLRKKGVSPITTTDGPSGIRIMACCSLLPNGTSLASMWNTDLAYNVYKKVGGEMKVKGSDVLLAPGMNIHRSPLCGRNFEYYSEDPFLTGKTAAAVVKGLQSEGVAACPKHFACNNQETNRNRNDSRLSERALREIYLKGFEICIKEAAPFTIMTSYNKVNGVWSHYNYDLCTRVLRNEWNFQGLVMTDWWMQYTSSPEFPNLKDNAYRVRAGVDVLMPGGKRTGPKKSDGTLLKTYGKPDGITLGEMQQTAKNVLNLVLQLK